MYVCVGIYQVCLDAMQSSQHTIFILTFKLCQPDSGGAAIMHLFSSVNNTNNKIICQK